MSTRLKEKEERILQVLEELAQKSAVGVPILVEGKKDAETLETLTIKGKIILAKSGGKSLFDVISEVEKCNTREVIILLDFDRKGKELTKLLKQNLEKIKVKPNTIFWKKLMKLVGHEIKDIEGLTSYLNTLKKKANGFK